MFLRLERSMIDYGHAERYGPYAFIKFLQNNNLMTIEFEDNVTRPLINLEYKLGMKYVHSNIQLPVTWKDQRPTHMLDPYLRDITRQYYKNNEQQYLMFGCCSLIQLTNWFTPAIIETLKSYDFRIMRYVATKTFHGLRQSMLDTRTIKTYYKYDD